MQVWWTDGLDNLWSVDLHFAVFCKAVAQIQVDEALVWSSSVLRHALEVLDNVLSKERSD